MTRTKFAFALVGWVILFGFAFGDASSATSGGVILISQANLPYVIKASGTYRLTSNLIPKNQSHTAITVTVPNVTIDLNGFSIIGGAKGIDATNQPLITIFNGQVSGAAGDGIVTAHSSRIERIRVFGNGGNGIHCTDGCEIDHCIVNNNGLSGILVIDSSNNGRGLISSNVVQYNGGSGIYVATAALVTGNSVSNNGDNGILCANFNGGGRAGVSNNVLNANSPGDLLNCVSLSPNLCSGSSC